MLEYITVFGRTLPMYGIMAALGFLVGLGAACLRCKAFGLSKENCVYIMAFGGVGAAIGAKIVYILTVLPDFIKDLGLITTNFNLFFEKYIASGMVFYGGLIGAVAASVLFCKYMKIRLSDYLTVLVPSFALIHAFGRVGCFFAGCCYGIEMPEGLGVTFTHSRFAPNNVSLFPVQLVEAGCEIVIFILLTILAHRAKDGVTILAGYVFLYAPIRFVLEFFRGDVVRGFLFGLSTSQWISILAVFLAALCLFLYERKNRNAPSHKNNSENNT